MIKTLTRPASGLLLMTVLLLAFGSVAATETNSQAINSERTTLYDALPLTVDIYNPERGFYRAGRPVETGGTLANIS